MPTPPDLGYVLVDPRPIAVESPYTFFLPTQRELDAIAEGDLVKLIFQLVPPGETYEAERMWVAITNTEATGLTGVLENVPHEAPISRGDAVKLQRYHVVGIAWANPELAPPESPTREYWSRCLVDECVLDDSEPVEYLYREAPDMQKETDPYPDSGWRIRGRQGGAKDEEMTGRKSVYIALGKVLNADDSWLHLIDEPIGSAFMRDFASGEYVPQ